MRTALAVPFAAWLAFAGCATDPEAPSSLPTASEIVVAEVAADAFVTTNGRRIPREAFVLELRLRTRAMSEAQRAAFRVEIASTEEGGDAALRHAEWILDQLQIMGVGQAALR